MVSSAFARLSFFLVLPLDADPILEPASRPSFGGTSVIARGLERRRLFKDDRDREHFLELLSAGAFIES